LELAGWPTQSDCQRSFELAAPVTGERFGEDLIRMVGQYVRAVGHTRKELKISFSLTVFAIGSRLSR
jgi:hypothetical protein